MMNKQVWMTLSWVLCNSSALLPNIALLEMSVVMPLFFGNWGDLVTLVSLVNSVKRGRWHITLLLWDLFLKFPLSQLKLFVKDERRATGMFDF